MVRSLTKLASICRYLIKSVSLAGDRFNTFMTKRTPKTYSNEYLEYLQSTKWHNKRLQTLKLTNYKCIKCTGKATEVHHLSYANLGKEKPGRDIVPLCTKCHNRCHFKKHWDNPKGREKMAKELQAKFNQFM